VLQWDTRRSFCCARENCRKRKTPPSVRFLGRKLYVGAVVVLLSAMMHGLKRKRVERLRNELGISERTLERWRVWWLENFVDSAFWKSARARFMPRVEESLLPLSLVAAFAAEGREGLIRLLLFIAPITAPARKGVAATAATVPRVPVSRRALRVMVDKENRDTLNRKPTQPAQRLAQVFDCLAAIAKSIERIANHDVGTGRGLLDPDFGVLLASEMQDA
jgi:hypothetical protein